MKTKFFNRFSFVLKNNLASIILAVGGWYTVLLVWSKGKLVLPWPHQVVNALLHLVQEKDFYHNFFLTLGRCLSGFAIGCVLASLLGFFMSRSRLAKKLLTLPVDFLRSLPAIVLLPLILFIVDARGPIHIVLTAVPVFLVMTLNFMYGFDRASALRKNVAKKLGLTEKETFFKVEIREALPEIVTGMRISISIALIMTIVAEMFFMASGGIGSFIYEYSQDSTKQPEQWGGVIILGFLGFALNKFFIWIDGRYCFWKGK